MQVFHSENKIESVGRTKALQNQEYHLSSFNALSNLDQLGNELLNLKSDFTRLICSGLDSIILSMLITNLLSTPANREPPQQATPTKLRYQDYHNVRQQLAFPHVQLIDLWPRRYTDRLCLLSRNLEVVEIHSVTLVQPGVVTSPNFGNAMGWSLTSSSYRSVNSSSFSCPSFLWFLSQSQVPAAVLTLHPESVQWTQLSWP